MNAVFLLSGGMDSQVLLARYRPNYGCAHCIGFDYGQRHRRELKHACQIAHYYGATWEEIALPRLGGSALTGNGELPKGLHYADPKQVATVVPGRNAVMLAVAVSVAQQRSANAVLFAAHAGDAAIYPDCRTAFVDAIDTAFSSAYGVRILAPFLSMTKRQIVTEGRRLHVPLEDSWSCYDGESPPCGECGACIERAEAIDGIPPGGRAYSSHLEGTR